MSWEARTTLVTVSYSFVTLSNNQAPRRQETTRSGSRLISCKHCIRLLYSCMYTRH